MGNRRHPTITFTVELFQAQNNFLYVTVSLEIGKIKTDLYVKPTDAHQYLNSCHPYHCKKGIPYVKRFVLIEFPMILYLLIEDVKI